MYSRARTYDFMWPVTTVRFRQAGRDEYVLIVNQFRRYLGALLKINTYNQCTRTIMTVQTLRILKVIIENIIASKHMLNSTNIQSWLILIIARIIQVITMNKRGIVIVGRHILKLLWFPPRRRRGDRGDLSLKDSQPLHLRRLLHTQRFPLLEKLP